MDPMQEYFDHWVADSTSTVLDISPSGWNEAMGILFSDTATSVAIFEGISAAIATGLLIAHRAFHDRIQSPLPRPLTVPLLSTGVLILTTWMAIETPMTLSQAVQVASGAVVAYSLAAWASNGSPK